jgi:hypothetical protein
VTGNPEERNRVLGFSVGSGPRRGRRGYEEQHVMGFPASWFDDVNVDALRWLVHPIGEYRRWTRRRRPEPRSKDADER